MSLPEQFGRYRVLDVLGQGAMGLVYKAVDPVIERGVAIKVIHAEIGLDEADLGRMQARFEQEFRSAGALSHANIVTVFDVGKEGDLYYIAMEYVEGVSLDTVIGRKGTLSFKEVGDLAGELSSGLDYAHGQGVVHRDIKPANVLITGDGRAKITDFGLAKFETTTLTRTGALVGTPAYMSPEQVGGQAITGKTDQFSLAIVLYQALTGERPFTGDSPSTIMYKIVHEEPLPPGQVNRSLPEAVDAVLLRALDKNVDRRYESCSELADGLRLALGASPEATPSGSVPRPAAADAATMVEQPSGTGPAPVASHQPSSASVQSPQAATPWWLLVLGVLLPSVALLAMVTWFISQSFSGAGGPDGVPAPAADSGQAGAPAAASPEELQEVRDEFLAEIQQLREQVAAEQQAPEQQVAEPQIESIGDEQPVAPPERPRSISYSISSDPEGAVIVVDGNRSGITTPADIELATDVDHRIEIAAPGYEPYRYEISMAGVPTENLPSGLHVALSRGLDAVAAERTTENRPAAGTPLSRGRGLLPEALDDVPEELRRFIDATSIPTGRISIESSYPVQVGIAPGRRTDNMAPELRRRLQSLSNDARRRVLQGFQLRGKLSHEIELPIGNWRVTLSNPRVFFIHEEQVVLRADQQLNLGGHVPAELFSVGITSDPPGARFRVVGLSNVSSTPHNGPIVPGLHRFQFFWGRETRSMDVEIDRDGMSIVGRREQ